MTLAEHRTYEMTSHESRPVKVLLERAFFSQENVLKVLVNNRNECYFQWGWKASAGWEWRKVKFNDAELGEIMLVLEGSKEKVAFFHSFGEGREKMTTQIWVHRSGGFCGFKVKECSKALNAGEQKVLLVLLGQAIVMMNLRLH